MVMLESGKNKDLGNKPYFDKRPVVATSGIKLTKRLADENTEWTPVRLDDRQKQLANFATTVWRVSQLSDARNPLKDQQSDAKDPLVNCDKT
jgi:hypothetical protein